MQNKLETISLLTDIIDFIKFDILLIDDILTLFIINESELCLID
jgi:hypothetical protein